MLAVATIDGIDREKGKLPKRKPALQSLPCNGFTKKENTGSDGTQTQQA